MPLPPALAAKLAKRGLLKESNLPAIDTGENEIHNKDEEEVIAEDYDETPVEPEPMPKPPPLDNFDKYQGWVPCPNKWNVYHECTPGCRTMWKESKEVNAAYNKKRLRMMQKYPLPNHWMEVLEPGVGRYYYWNTDTDMVSWLPPGHPKCQVSRSAPLLRKQMMIDREQRLNEERQKSDDEESDAEDSSDEEKVERKSRKRKGSVDIDSSDSSEESDEEPEEDRDTRSRDRREKEYKYKEKERERERSAKERPRKSRKKDDLDPMDPAAYSDCPRGTWASGLPQKDEAKTGVDTTAGGPLFQMRPYPNPGSVLRNNASSQAGPKKPQ